MNKRNNYKKNSPESAMCEFLHAWKDKDIDLMIKLSTPTWKKFYRSPEESIKFLFGHFTLTGGVIQNSVSIRKDGICYAMRTKLFLLTDDGKKIEKKVDWLVWYETKDYKYDLSLDALWAVNPLSGSLSLNKGNIEMQKKIKSETDRLLKEAAERDGK